MSFAALVERLQRLETPYPGLRPFETEESHLFFGRDQQVAELVQRLERHRFLAVLGVSGSGKSSLVRAGLIPALQRGRVSEAGSRWRIVVTRPAGAPFDSLAGALGRAGLDASPLRTSSHGLIAIARQLPPDESLLVVVDQFEELFRYKDLDPTDESKASRTSSAADAAEFVQLLLASSRHQPLVYVVLTMRSDYLGECAEFRDLPETLNDCQYLVPRLTREQRKEAIERPLGRVAIAPSLVQRMLNDAGDEPDQLPVLQHALMRTWNEWRRSDPDQRRRIELQDYEAVGGFDGALNQHAASVLADVPREIAAAVFKRLTARGRNNRERRDPATLRELWGLCGADTTEQQAAVNAVIDRFRLGEATFLMPRAGTIGPDTYIDITHESLIRQWQTLRDEWLPEEERAVRTFKDLSQRARSWKAGSGELLVGLDLKDARGWQQRQQPSAAWAAHYAGAGDLAHVVEYVAESEKREQARQRRRRWTMIALGTAALVFAMLAAVALRLWMDAAEARDAAARAREASVARQLAAQAQLLFGEQSQPPFDVLPAALLAIESMRRAPTREGELALRETTRLLPRVVAMIATPDGWPVFSADGKWVAVREETAVRLFDSGTGAEVWRLVPDAPVHEMAFTPDASVLVVANEKTLVAAERQTGKVLWRILSNGRASIAFSRDGTRIVTDASQALRLVDVRTGGVLWSVDRDVRDPVFSGDGQTITALVGTKTIVTFDAASGKETRRLQSERDVQSFAVGLDGRAVVVTDNTSGTHLFAPWLSRPRPVDDAVFSRDGMLVLEDLTGFLTVDPSGKMLSRLPTGGTPFAFAPDDSGLLLSQGDLLQMIDPGSSSPIWSQRFPRLSSARATTTFSHDGGLLFVLQAHPGDQRRIVRVIDAGQGFEVARTFQPVRDDAIAGSDGRWVVATTRTAEDGRVEPLIAVFEAERPLHTALLPPDSLRTAVLGEDGRLTPPAEDDGPLKQALIAKLPVAVERTFVTALSANKRWLAVGGEVQGISDLALGVVEVFDVGAGKPSESKRHILPSTFIRDIVFSGDGTLLAVGAGSSVKTFTTADGREVFSATVSGVASALAFSEDNRRLAVGADRTAYVFDVPTGDEQSRIQVNGTTVVRLRFGESGRYLVTAADNNPVSGENRRTYVEAVRHFLRPDDLVRDACSRMPRNLTPEEWRRYLGAEEPYRRTCEDLPQSEPR